MSTVNKYFLPHRATTDVMKDPSKSSIVLRKGELFVEAPSTGVGTGHSKIKIGDGKTPYSSLPYALGDTDTEVTNAIVTFTSNTGTSAKDVINGVKSGQSLATQIAGLKQAITLLANTPFTNRAFSTISDGNTQSVSATGTGDTLKVTAGSNVTLTFNNTNKSINIAAKDTTYVNATSSASGLMSAADKAKIDAISSGANKTAVTQKLSSGTNIGSVTIDGKTTELFAPTNTHYEAKNIVANSSTSTSDTTTALGNGSVNLNLVEDGKVRSSHTIKGSGATTVTTDTSGNIVINSIDNNTTYGQASDAKAGISKLYGTYGKNTDGSVTQDFITSELNNKLPIDGIAAKANQDSLGNNLSNYIDDAAVNGQTVTFIRGNGSTFSIHTQDNDTKYDDFVGATTAKNGGHGLVPAPTTSQTGYYLRGDGTWRYPSDVKVDNASNADRASTATVDSAGQNINTTYVKGVTGSNANVTVTKGNGATSTFTVNNVANAGTASYARSASTATADSAGNNINTTYVKSVTGAGATVTITKGNGATTGFIVDGVASAATATADSAGQIINTTYVKGVTGSNATVTVTKGNGDTAAFTVNNVANASTANYAKAASTATVDSAGQAINTTYIKNLAVSGRTITFTKGNGATATITTQDTNTTYDAFKGATSSANGGPGLVPAPTTANANQYLKGDGTWANISGVIAGTKVNNASEADHASRADNAATATADSAGQIINTTYVKGVTGSNATVTVTKGNGDTAAFTVNNVANAGKATNDSAGQNINTTYIKSITYSGHTVTVTKGNGATSTFDTADNNTTYVTGTETTSGLTKLYGSSGTSTDGTMTRAAITNLVAQTKSTLETAIGKINSFEIVVIDQGGSLPTTGADHTVYFLPYASGDSDTKYEEYIWLTDYYEKIGMTTADLGNYYTKAETNTQITNATNSLVSSVTYSGHTVTITKKDGSTSSFATADNNTTYNAGTGLSLSGTTFSINAGASTVAHASSADSSTNDSAGNNINNTYVKGVTYSGHTVTITKGNGSTTSFNTADNNTTYANFKGATSSANGDAGLVPAPTTAQTGMYLKGDGTWANISGVITGTKVNNASTADYASSASNSTKATNDSAGQNINTTYIKSLSVSGRTITYTKGNGATGTITTQDTDTTYDAFKGATSSANGGPGLVPGPTSAQVGMYLRGDGTWHSPNDVKVNTASHADSADNASNATNASTAAYAKTASNADNATNAATATYAKTAGSANAVAWSNVSGKPSTYTPSAHTHTSIESVLLTNQDLNDYKSNSVQFLYGMGGNTVANKPSGVDAFGVYTYRSAQGFYTQELVDTNGTKYLRFYNSTSWTAWKTIVDSSNVAGYKVNNAGYADSAGKATNDSAGQNINTTYIKNLAVSGKTITYTKGNGATGTITTQDTNTTYNAGTGLSLNGTTFSINAGASTVAHASSADSSTKDSAGNNINNTYIKNLSINGRTITFTKGNGSTTAITTQDTNTTYDTFKGATSSANGGNGLVPAPTTAQKDMYLKGDGTWANISGVIVGTKVTSAANADSAGKATNDSAGQNINTTYIKSLSVSGRTITYTKGNGATGTITTQDTDTNTTYSAGTGLSLNGTTFSINAGASTVAYATNAGNGISNITRSGTTFTVTRQNGSTFSFNQQDNNSTYNNFKGATTATAGGNGLVPAPTTAQVGFYLRGDGTWHSPSDVKANNAGYSDSAGKATNDSAGNNINTTYIKSLSVNGRVITYTKGNGTTGSITTQDTDTNTTYSAGTGLTLSGTKFSINAGASTVAYATNAGNSGKATNDSAGNNINSTYVKSVTYSGHTVTITKGNGATTSFNTADNNTTYSALKNPNAITISLNGTSQGAYDGSVAKSINITAASVGAAASSHSHSEYIKRTGDTMSGALNFANNIANAVGDDVYIGDFNKGGHLGILGKSNNTGITLIKAAGSWSTATSSASIDYDATNGCISFVFA